MTYDITNTNVIYLGRQGENLARTVEIDVSSIFGKWPNATISLLVQRNQEDTFYLAPVVIENGILKWTISNADTEFAGDGKAEIRATQDDVIVKSAMMNTHVSDSLGGTETDIPDPAQTWADTIIAASEQAKQSAEDALASELAAKEAAESITGLESNIKTAEAARVEAEKGRAMAESDRVAAEEMRESAESSRGIAESERVAAESERMTAENKRVTAETARSNAETNRASAEQERQTAEGTRVSAETSRETAENNRVAAETERAATFIGYQNEINQFKTEIVTDKDAATENTRFAIGTAEQTLEVPSMKEFNELKDDFADLKSIVVYDNKRFEETIQAIAGVGFNAQNVVLPVEIKSGEFYVVTCDYPAGISQIDGVYEQYEDGTSTSIKYNVQSGVAYPFTAAKDVVGISLYIKKDNVTENCSFTLSAVVPNYNDKSIEAKVDRIGEYFEAITLTHDDIEYGAIQDGTGVNIYDGQKTRTRTKGYIPALSGTVIISTRSFNVWEYDPITKALIHNTSGWKLSYTVESDCLIRITWNTVTSGDVIAETKIIKLPACLKTVCLPLESIEALARVNLDQSMNNRRWDMIPSSTIKSISHRGRYGSNIGAMCCASAVVAARKQGYQYVENDVALTSDGHFVMWHDTNLARIGDPDHGVSDYTLEELKAKDFGAYAGFPGEKILTFAEWILCAKELGMGVYVDFKINPTDEQAEELVRIVRRYGMLKNTSWLTYGRKIRAYDPSARIGVLYHATESNIVSLSDLKESGEVFFNGEAETLTADSATLALDNGYGLECWLVDFAMSKAEVFAEIERLASLGVQRMTLDVYRADDAFNAKYGLTS